MANFSIMSAVAVSYEPQGNQSFRCSPNFQGWNNPAGGQLKFETVVPEGYPEPTFVIDHDIGVDTRWYSNLSDGAVVTCDKGQLGHDYKLYVGTTSKLGPNLDGSTQYVVIVWAASAS